MRSAWVTVVLHLHSCDGDCSLNDEAFALAGNRATDCGHFENGELTTDGFECAAAAFESSRAFVLRMEQVGKDSHVARALVGQRDGDVFGLHYDGDPSGGGGDGNPKIQRAPCINPRVIVVQEPHVASHFRLEIGDRMVECAEGDLTTICE